MKILSNIDLQANNIENTIIALENGGTGSSLKNNSAGIFTIMPNSGAVSLIPITSEGVLYSSGTDGKGSINELSFKTDLNIVIHFSGNISVAVAEDTYYSNYHYITTPGTYLCLLYLNSNIEGENTDILSLSFASSATLIAQSNTVRTNAASGGGLDAWFIGEFESGDSIRVATYNYMNKAFTARYRIACIKLI